MSTAVGQRPKRYQAPQIVGFEPVEAQLYRCKGAASGGAGYAGGGQGGGYGGNGGTFGS